ncbi:Transposable element Tcb2 transposase [Araneus ventricosus]|uniref:Transposable element Tcb2 transposase n=1 Tax=Araneus ventricosus TaxID=182803 RepID=A0A4Y2JEX5_ARAVE|nr:Transposable element Tcb2 transposase [Araneus ventricosus]
MEDTPSRNLLSLRRIAWSVWNGRRRTSTGPRKSEKRSFGVMETNTCFFGAGILWIHRPQGTGFDPKNQIPTMRHGGGNAMVCRCVSRLLRIMDKFQYEDILENTMRQYACNSLSRGFIFQQNDDPMHRSKHIQNWFSRRHVTSLTGQANTSP